MKSFRLFLVVFVSLILIPISHAQKSLDGVVKIESYDNDGNLIETGSGIITGKRGQSLFIVTALHVVEESDVFQVSFQSRKWDSFTASRHEKYNEDLDYAVLIVNVPENTVKTHEFHQAEFSNIKTGNQVKLIGHPGGEDWTYNKQNVVNNPQYTTFEISASNTGIGPGYSGGALLTKKKDQLMGLIVNVETNNTISVRIDQVLRDLKSWGIPTGYILPYKPPRRVSSYIFAGLSAGAAVGAVYFHTEKNRIYDVYSTQRDPAAPAFTLPVHEDYVGPRSEALDKAKDNQNYSYYAAAATGGFALLSIILSKRKYKYQDGNLSDVLNNLEPTLGIASAGISYKF